MGDKRMLLSMDSCLALSIDEAAVKLSSFICLKLAVIFELACEI